MGRRGVLIFEEKRQDSTLSRWTKEMAHGYQFSTSPAKYKYLFVREHIVALYQTLFQNKKFREKPKERAKFSKVYSKIYFRKGSFEYEAHEQFEVQLNMYIKYRLHQSLPQK